METCRVSFKSLKSNFLRISLVWLGHVLPVLSFTSFIFGDSLVDSGNNNFLFTLSRADSPPYGIDFKPSGGRPTGRFTNGRTISDILGQALGAKSFPPPYLGPNSQADTIHRGINYASGAAGIFDETGVLFIERIPLREQVDYFEKSRAYMVKVMGENGTKEFLKKALFSITIGSNDILNYIQPSIPFFGQDKVSTSVLQDFMVSNLTIHLKRLHRLGAKKFVVVGVGPLGCIPFVRALKLISTSECSDEVNEIIQGYNTKLKRVLSILNQEMRTNDDTAIFVYADSYDVFMKLVLNYHQYGLENADKPCCGGYFPPFICFESSNRNTSSVVCEDRSRYVFWDAYHPTEAANLMVARELLDGNQTVATPLNIRALYGLSI